MAGLERNISNLLAHALTKIGAFDIRMNEAAKLVPEKYPAGVGV